MATCIVIPKKRLKFWDENSNCMRLFVCGDIVNRTPGLDFVGDNLKTIIKKSDYAVCNFEGPELMYGQKAICPHQEPGTAAYLKEVGFDLMLLSNNHITELGAEGLQFSISAIKQTGMDYIGAGLSWEEAYKPLIRKICDLSFGFINICEAQEGQYLSPEQLYGYAWMGYDGLFKDVKKLSEKVDNVIVFCHAGLEHYDIPMAEIRDFYHRLCDAGANAVIGGHTHCAQGYEFYNGKFIVYSLGNFYFPYSDDRWSDENTSYSLELDFNKEGVVSIMPVHHCLNMSGGGVELLMDKSKQKNVLRLCSLLNNSYDDSYTKMCIDAYDNLCRRLLAEATCGINDDISFFHQIKRFLRYCLFRKKTIVETQSYRNALILRLFENETYRWTIIRALKSKSKY